MTKLLSCALTCCAISAVLLPAAAHAAVTDSALLVCGEKSVRVTGFGRGQALDVVGTTQKFVVTRAETGGTLVFEAPGQAGRADVLRCTTTAPGGRDFRFEGFFTPRR